MKNILIIVLLIDAVLLVISILLQQKGSGLSGVFGGSSVSYLTRRGAEKFLTYFTVFAAAVLIVSAFLILFAK